MLSKTVLKFNLAPQPLVLHILRLLCLGPESQEQNKALVSFFSAMVTVTEKVQPGFMRPHKGIENKVTILKWCHSLLANDSLLSKILPLS